MTTEEKITEKIGEETIEKITEKIGEEKMDKEDIIDNYIGHIRDISRLTNDEIESVINDAIEEDEELLDILRKFLEKRENIREKSVSIEIEERDDEDKAKNKEEMDDILDAFEDPDYAYPLEDIIESLRGSGYEDPGKIIVDAINDKILYVDSIDEDGIIYIALTEEGDSLWESRNR